jgi:hypothetical protein
LTIPATAVAWRRRRDVEATASAWPPASVIAATIACAAARRRN